MYLRFKQVLFIGDYVLEVFLGAAITLLVLESNTRIDFENRISLFWGELTFGIYLIHGPVFEILERIHVWNYGTLYIF